MSTALLLNTGNFKVLVRDGKVSPHLLQSFIGNGINPKLFLTLSETKP
jgi:hypothetical protein